MIETFQKWGLLVKERFALRGREQILTLAPQWADSFTKMKHLGGRGGGVVNPNQITSPIFESHWK